MPILVGWGALIVAPITFLIYRHVGDRTVSFRLVALYGAGLVSMVVGILFIEEAWAAYPASIGAALAGTSFVLYAGPWALALSRIFGWVWRPYRNPEFMRVYVILLGVAAWLWATALLLVGLG